MDYFLFAPHELKESCLVNIDHSGLNLFAYLHNLLSMRLIFFQLQRCNRVCEYGPLPARASQSRSSMGSLDEFAFALSNFSNNAFFRFSPIGPSFAVPIIRSVRQPRRIIQCFSDEGILTMAATSAPMLNLLGCPPART